MSEETIDEELSELFTKLWNLDTSGCYPGVHYEVNLQGYLKRYNMGQDFAADKFFSWVDENSIFQLETYKSKHLMT